MMRTLRFALVATAVALAAVSAGGWLVTPAEAGIVATGAD